MTPLSADSPLILASTSHYRAEALRRLRLPFVQQAPDVDEAEWASESADQRAIRLSLEKARAVARRHPGGWVLGSDQVAVCDDRVLHKPGTPAANVDQLLSLSGREAQFVTGIALINDQTEFTDLDITTVRFRELHRAEVERYVQAEPAQDCAGGFKVEGLGICLFEQIHSLDPTALIGLPLIALRRLLGRAGYSIP